MPIAWCQAIVEVLTLCRGFDWYNLGIDCSLFPFSRKMLFAISASFEKTSLPFLSQSENLNLRDMARDKILILITHRLYNLQIADLIITMDNGAIAEEGTFEELKNNKGLFYSMFEKQIAKEEAG
jgi:hypothetical protein